MTQLGEGLPFPNGGSTLSGVGHSPCPDVTSGGNSGPTPTEVAGSDAPPRADGPASSAFPDDALSDALRLMRMVKPFTARPLADALFQLIAHSNGISNRLTALQIDTPTTPDEWCDALFRLSDDIDILAVICKETTPRLERMIEEAEHQHARSETAIRAIIAGLNT